jgi:hypothetical protein
MENNLSEKAIKAGVTPEEGEFIEKLLPVLVFSSLLGISLLDQEDVDRLIVIFDKLKAVDDDMPPAIMEMVERIRAKSVARKATPGQNAPSTSTMQ